MPTDAIVPYTQALVGSAVFQPVVDSIKANMVVGIPAGVAVLALTMGIGFLISTFRRTA